MLLWEQGRQNYVHDISPPVKCSYLKASKQRILQLGEVLWIIFSEDDQSDVCHYKKEDKYYDEEESYRREAACD